jgi:maltodextrin utilization protein YvdJ
MTANFSLMEKLRAWYRQYKDYIRNDLIFDLAMLLIVLVFICYILVF